MLWLMMAARAATGSLAEPEGALLWTSARSGTYFGWAVADVQDLDGDGVSEVITGDPYAGVSAAGLTVVLSGRDGAERFFSEGTPGSYEGYSVSSAGEQSGDGISDVISGTPGADAAIVYSGADGTVVRVLAGDPGALFGTAVARAGDVDGDGLDEVVVGAESADISGTDAGRVYLFSGADGALIWSRDGEAAGELLGSGAGYLGDVTSDGVPDVLVGARGAGGAVYVLSGIDGSTVHKIVEPGSSSLGAFFVSGVGDMDGDGSPEIYGGDYANSALGPGTGRAWVWSGATGVRRFEFTGEGPGDGLGPGRYAGDVDGDGVPDVVIGSYLYSGGAPSAGRVTVLSGADGSTLRTVTSTKAGENFGFDTIGLGDTDGDGTIDLLVSAATGNHVYLVGTAAPEPTTPPIGDDTSSAPAGDTSSAPAGDTGSPSPAAEKGCGCRSAPQTGLLGLLWLAWSRRRS